MADTTPTFLTIEEVAELLRLSERHVYALARKGELPGAIKLGNRWRIHRGVLIAWMKAEATVPQRTKGAA